MSGASGTSSRIPITRNHWLPRYTSGPPSRDLMPRRSAATDPTTTTGVGPGGLVEEGALRRRSRRGCRAGWARWRRPRGRRSETPGSGCCAVRWRCRRCGWRWPIRQTAMRRIMSGAAVGSSAASPKAESPGWTCRKLVPSASSSASRSALLDAEMPTTATMAAMPMAMPRPVSRARVRLTRSPSRPRPMTSPGRRRGRGRSMVTALMAVPRPLVRGSGPVPALSVQVSSGGRTRRGRRAG